MLLLLRGLLSTPLAWTARRVAGTNAHSHILTAITTSSTRMASSSVGDAATTSHLTQSYAGIFAQSPGISKAWAFSCSSDEDTETFMLQRTARDIEGNKMRSFVQSYEMTDGNWRLTSPFPLELKDVVSFCPSPSGKLLAIIREDSPGDGKDPPPKNPGYVIEVWGNEEQGGCLLDQIPTAGTHGKLIGDTWFGGLEWAPDESKLVYVAQKKAVETRSFFARPPLAANDDGAPSTVAGGQFLYEEDWGEKYDGVSRLGLFVADLGGTGKIEEISGISTDLTPGQPRFSPDGKHIVYTAWQCEPRKLGMIYCYQRPCNLYSAPISQLVAGMELDGTPREKGSASGEAKGGAELGGKEGEARQQGEASTDQSHVCLCPSWRLARSARFSPSGDSLVWLSREEGFDTHSGCFRLSTGSWDAETGTVVSSKTLVDIVRIPEESKGGFPGLWVDNLPDACFSPDGSSVYISSAWGSRQSVVKVNVGTGQVERVVEATIAARQDPTTGEPVDASAAVLTVGKCGVYVAGSSPNSPGGFAVVPPEGAAAIPGPEVGGVLVTPYVRVQRGRMAELKTALSGVRWSVLSIPLESDDGDSAAAASRVEQAPFEAILMMPPRTSCSSSDAGTTGKGKVPLVVVPHGGPHGVIPTSFVPSYAFLCATQGVAVLHVNFRGSTGFGTEALESLPGRIGIQDVADVVAATRAALALESDALDPERIGVVGGSHGGFLGSHLTAQHPQIFKVAALRNPVTNIASMVTVSDIPDWCYIEALGCGKYDFDKFRPPSAEELKTMWEMSPIKHVKGVKAPTLVALGAKDRRVPQSQGLEWFHALKSQGVEVKLLVYPEDVHAIDKPASEADQWLNIVSWLNKHLE